MEQSDVRRHINKQFSIRGHSLSKDALSYLVDQLKNMRPEQCKKTLGKVMELIEKENGLIFCFINNIKSFFKVESGLLDLNVFRDVLKALSRQRKNERFILLKLKKNNV